MRLRVTCVWIMIFAGGESAVAQLANEDPQTQMLEAIRECEPGAWVCPYTPRPRPTPTDPLMPRPPTMPLQEDEEILLQRYGNMPDGEGFQMGVGPGQ